MDKNLDPTMSARIATLLYLLPEKGQKISFFGKIPLDDMVKADPISSSEIESIRNIGNDKFVVTDASADISFEELTGEQQELMVAKALIWSNDNMKKNGVVTSMFAALDECRKAMGNEFPAYGAFVYDFKEGYMLDKFEYNEEEQMYYGYDKENDDYCEISKNMSLADTNSICSKAYVSLIVNALDGKESMTLKEPIDIINDDNHKFTVKSIEKDKYGVHLIGKYADDYDGGVEESYVDATEVQYEFSPAAMKRLAEHVAKGRERGQSETPGLTATEYAVVYSVFKNVFQNLPDHYDIADVKEVAKGVNPHPDRIDGEELAGIIEEMLNVNSLVVQNKTLTDRQQSILKIESTIAGGPQKMAEFLKPEINTHDSLEFDGKKWPLRSIILPHTGENVLIGTEALEQALHPDEWNGRKAQAIYERIFYYVSDKDLQQPAAKLAAQVEKEALGLGDIISLNGEKLEVGMKVFWNDPDESARDLSRVWTIDNINGEVISISDGYSEAEVTANELNVVDTSKRSYDEVFKEAESLLQKFLPNYGDGMNFKPDDAPDVTRNTCAAFVVNTGTDIVKVIDDYSDQYSFFDVSTRKDQKIFSIVPVMSVFQQSQLEKYVTAMKEHGAEAVELYNLRKEVIADLKEHVVNPGIRSFSDDAVQRIRDYSKSMLDGQQRGTEGMAIIDSIKDTVQADPEVTRKPDKWFTDAAKEFDDIVNGDKLSEQMHIHFHR